MFSTNSLTALEFLDIPHEILTLCMMLVRIKNRLSSLSGLPESPASTWRWSELRIWRFCSISLPPRSAVFRRRAQVIIAVMQPMSNRYMNLKHNRIVTRTNGTMTEESIGRIVPNVKAYTLQFAINNSCHRIIDVDANFSTSGWIQDWLTQDCEEFHKILNLNSQLSTKTTNYLQTATTQAGVNQSIDGMALHVYPIIPVESERI